MKLSNLTVLFLILVVATLLRVYDLFHIPYTYDEFSALFRTRFDSFSELIEKGVKVDTLPAGIQVLLYLLTGMFGWNEWIIKMPFILSGILSAWLIFLVARLWYNETAGLISAAFVASLQYTVIYSQIARPYASGLFLVLLMVYFWSKIIKTPEKRLYLNSYLFIISATLCAYNHHFSLLVAAVAGISGLFLIERKYLVRYLISCVIICILYLPHLEILFAQMKMKGNEGWLGTLRYDFILNYFRYVFQYSIVSYLLVLLIIIYGIFKKEKHPDYLKTSLLFLTWFCVPFVTGFVYSRLVNNVMQFSVLIFSFPFLLFLLFGHFKALKPTVNLILVVLILAVNIFSLVYVRKHYSVFYNSQYVHILTDRVEAEQQYGEIPSIIDSDKNISDYYIRKMGLDSNFTWYDQLAGAGGFEDFLHEQTQKSDYLYFGCLSSNPATTVPVIREYYPFIKTQNNYSGGTTYIFSKSDGLDDDRVEYWSFSGDPKEHWTAVKPDRFIDTDGFSCNDSYLVDSSMEWSPVYSRVLDENLMPGSHDFIDISVRVSLPDTLREVILVASLERDKEFIHWGGSKFDLYLDPVEEKGFWKPVYYSINLANVHADLDGALLKVYVWNKGRAGFLMDDFLVRFRKGNPVVYGLVEEI